MATDTDKRAKDIVERVEACKEERRKEGLHDEWTEVFRAYKCRTKPIMVKNSETGKEEEDKTRTNVAMPDISIMVRRNTARLTANPPKIRYIGGSDPLIAEALTSLSYLQFDRSNEFREHRRHVMQAELLGWSVSKVFWDSVEVGRQFRYDREKFRDRAAMMKKLGAPDDEIQQAVSELGAQISDQELAQVISAKGPDFSATVNVKKYEGPIVKTLFYGDVFYESGVNTLNDSSFVSEQYKETDLWLQKMAKRTFIDPDSGQEFPVFDAKAVVDLLDQDCQDQDETKLTELRTLFLNVVGMDRPAMEKRLLPGKKFKIIESHELGDDGRLWINWVGNGKVFLGKMPYPVDLYGKYNYTELVPLPDLISVYGDSTPRLLRHLYYLHNITVGQRTDYMTNLLKVLMLRNRRTDLAAEFVDRGPWRELLVSDINGVKPLDMPPLPPGAWEQEGQIMRQMGIAEPSLNNVDTGSSANPMAGKTATTAVLASKAADALTQFKLDGVAIYLKELGEKKLWMNQQLREMGDPWEIGPEYPRGEALSERYGKTAVINLDPMEIQEDYQIEPDIGSILSVDDELRRQAAMELDTIAQAAPDVLDRKKVVRFHLSTIRGIGNPDDYILPDQQGTPMPPFKGNINISVPFDKLPSDVQNQILPAMGFQPSPELEQRDTMEGLTKVASAADAAANLASPAQPQEAEVPQGGEVSNG